MNDHLGYNRYNRSDLQNARNGVFQKTLITNNGVIELDVPRDRNGEFEPAIVKKKQSRVAGLDQKIISLYAKGMSLSDIKMQQSQEIRKSQNLLHSLLANVIKWNN